MKYFTAIMVSFIAISFSTGIRAAQAAGQCPQCEDGPVINRWN